MPGSPTVDELLPPVVDDRCRAPRAALPRAAPDSAWLSGAYVVAFAIALIQNVVLAREDRAGGFGLLAMVVATVTFVQQLLGSVWEAVTTFVVAFLD